MNTTEKLTQLLKQYIPFTFRRNSKGWEPIVCKVCNDHGRKGPRAAFKFEHNSIGYHCFNCDHTAVFSEENQFLSNDFITVLESFQIPSSEWEFVHLNRLSASNTKLTQHKTEFSYPKPIPLPNHFIPLKDDNTKWGEIARYYLTERKIDPDSYSFLMSDEQNWKGRLIIPIYYRGNLIFYQGRALYNNPKKYISSIDSDGGIISNLDELHAPNKTIYITEGWFDSYHLNGFAVFSSKLTNNQIKIFESSKNPKVVVLDKGKDGKRMGKQVLELGWSISVPEFGSCGDVNSAIQKFGVLYVLNTIREQTKSGIEAKVALELW